jgi:hypothetical protein
MAKIISGKLKAATLMLFFFPSLVNAQVVRGLVTDKESGMPLPGVNVIIEHSGTMHGAATDTDGRYLIEGVPLGRHTARASYIGYSEAEHTNLIVSPGRQAILDFKLEESSAEMGEVVIAASKKSESVNQMATVSARTFSTEESERFAGSLGDVSRMATNFAGVQAANDAVNEIVIRGNSPGGLLWRLDGINIPNPNHYGDADATAGPVSMLNNNVLANSDFFTGAFSAEYGNALSGVFDLRTRNGNSEKFEFLGQVGFNGYELGAEGPLGLGKRSSFLANYRYSTLALLAAMGVPMGTGNAIPYYQDAVAKLHIPAGKAGIFNVLAMGGNNHIDFIDSKRDTSEKKESFYQEFESDLRSENALGLVAITHSAIISPKLHTKAAVAASRTYNGTIIDSIGYLDRTIWPYYRGKNYRNSYQLNFSASWRPGEKHRVLAGADTELRTFELDNKYYDTKTSSYRELATAQGSMRSARPYISWQFRPVQKLSFTAGLHSHILSLGDGRPSIEPRAGVKWQLSPKDRIGAGVGVHTQSSALPIYYSASRLHDGSYVHPNKAAGLTYSNHYVLSYDREFSTSLRLKTELYYQQIYKALVDGNSSSSFSLLNTGSMTQYGTPDTLANKGTGSNYGIEITFEKFLDKGFYFLNTISVFQSEYKGSDNITRSTAFNSNLCANLLIGREYAMGKKKEAPKSRKFITTDAKLNYALGKPYSPIDIETSRRKQTISYYDSRAYENRFPYYFRMDLRIGLKMMEKKSTHEFAVDLQNTLNRRNIMGYRYNTIKGQPEEVYQIGMVPMMLYRLTF